jgi:sulfhydrogenase subunit beta (sulfur reductase)
LAVLKKRGYQVLGPTIRDGAIVYGEIGSVPDMPVGRSDEQNGGHYRLTRRSDQALFGYNAGPNSWKEHLLVPRTVLWRGRRDGMQADAIEIAAPRQAFVGVRACDLAAIAVLDKVMMEGPFADATYRARRDNVFLVAVNCSQSGGTCFCASMKTGPKVTGGYDLALTEILSEGPPRFLVEVGSEHGQQVLKDIPHRAATPLDMQAAERILTCTAAAMGRTLNTTGLRESLYANLEHPHWNEVATRCLTCANCTLVCPTCFCTTIEDTTSLSGDHAQRERRWDSCFTLDFTYLHGGSVRSTPRARYRHWLIHKLATWVDQFGTMGCVGCGRCITWCPVGIDITEEAAAIGKPIFHEVHDGND